MLQLGKSSQLFNRSNNELNELSSLLDLGMKRPYKSDMKPFNDIFTPKNITLTIVKAAIIPLNSIVNDFNFHNIQQQEKEDHEIKDFDWNASIKLHQKEFLPNLHRVASITLIKKSCEEGALYYLSDKMVDKLTKDVTKSIMRKCSRMNRFAACQKVLHTAFWGNLLFNLSCFIYDVGFQLCTELSDIIYNAKVSKELSKRIVYNIKFIGKKAVYYTVCLGSCAAGHAVGTFFHSQYGGTIGGFAFELVGGLTVSHLLKM